jgi:hypothetical protein
VVVAAILVDEFAIIFVAGQRHAVKAMAFADQPRSPPCAPTPGPPIGRGVSPKKNPASFPAGRGRNGS